MSKCRSAFALCMRAQPKLHDHAPITSLAPTNERLECNTLIKKSILGNPRSSKPFPYSATDAISFFHHLLLDELVAADGFA
jgi:hypothetical protein